MDDVEKYIGYLISNWQGVRTEGANELVRIGKPAVPALVKVLQENIGARAKAAEVLGEIGDPSAVPALIEALKDISLDFRKSAAKALVKIGKPAVPALMTVLRDNKRGKTMEELLDDADVRQLAARALEDIGDHSATLALVEALDDDDATVRRDSGFALEDIIRRADTVEVAEGIEAKIRGASADLGKKHGDRRIEAMMVIAKLLKKVAGKKNELASKRDVLLDEKPKPPQGGQMFQAARRPLHV